MFGFFLDIIRPLILYKTINVILFDKTLKKKAFFAHSVKIALPTSCFLLIKC